MSHVTRTPFSRSKGQGHQAALLTAMLARQAATAVGVGMCWPWETAATLPSARRRKALRRPRGKRGRGHIVSAGRLQLVQSCFYQSTVFFIEGHVFAFNITL